MHKYYALVTRTSHIGNMPQRYYYGSIYGINNNFSAFAIVHRFLGTLIVFYVITIPAKKGRYRSYIKFEWAGNHNPSANFPTNQ